MIKINVGDNVLGLKEVLEILKKKEDFIKIKII